MLKLAHRVSVYVCVASHVQTVVQHLAGAFGGATVTHGQGYWYDEHGNCYIDETRIVTSYANRPISIQELTPLLEWMFDNSNELAISIETGEGLHIINRAEILSETKSA